MAVGWYHARAELGRSGRVRVVHPGFFFGVVLLAAKIQARPQPRESDLLELPGEVPEGFGDGRQGGSFRDHGFILDLGRIAGRSAGDHGPAVEGSAGWVVALDMVRRVADVLLANPGQRAYGC